ncbi:MAG: carbohydrate kinase family protein [Propioniciclava sp.]
MSPRPVVSLGEPVLDLVWGGTSPRGNSTFEAYPGGGAANVLAQVALLGGEAAMIGEVGDDFLGRGLLDRMGALGIDTSLVRASAARPTGVGFVLLAEDGERSFVFHRDAGARSALFTDDDQAFLREAGWFHFTSVTLGSAQQRQATLSAVACARAAGVPVSFDVNYRPSLWEEPRRAVSTMLRCCETATVVKMSDDERDALFPGDSNVSCAERLHRSGVALVCISLGRAGSFFSVPGIHGDCPTVPVRSCDTTGCGDAFMGTLLHGIRARGGLSWVTAARRSELEELFARANIAGAVCSTRFGSMTAVASAAEIDELQKGLRR